MHPAEIQQVKHLSQMTGMTGTKIYVLSGKTKSANCHKLLLFQTMK